MPRTLRLPAVSDERTVLVVRRHWWLLCRAFLPLLCTAGLLPLYAACEVTAPQAELSRFEGLFLTGDLALCGILFLKWLVADLAPWWTEPCIITTRRAILYRGVLVRERRETALSGVADISCAIRGAQGRLFQFGDLTIQPMGRNSRLIFKDIPGPRKVQALLAAQARAAREAAVGVRQDGGAIGAALGRIFQGKSGSDDNPTLAVGPITSLAARAQHRLTLLPGEVVISAGRRRGTVLAGRLTASFLLIAGLDAAAWRLALDLSPGYWLAAVGGLGMWVGWAAYDWRNLLHVLTTQRILEMRCSPLNHAVRRAVSLNAVEDVLLRQVSVGGRLCRVGTLVVESGADRPLHLRAAADPEALQRRLLDAVEAARRLSRLREQEHLASTLTDWFEEYHRLQVQS
ncbi:MAG: hypothetical protein ACRDIE_17300 [Chloroflexota bacterium]